MNGEMKTLRTRSKRRAAKNAGDRGIESFYASALDEAERDDLIVARGMEGVDDELAVLRVRLKKAIEKGPEHLPLMLRGIDVLVRLVAARYRLPAASAEDFAAALRSTIQDAGLDGAAEGLPDE